MGGSGYGMGVAVGDYDNDGLPDIFLANVTGNQLFHNNGNGTFSDVTSKAGVSGGIWKGKKMWSVSAAWVDYNSDGLLDLFVTNYVEWEVNHDPVCMAGQEREYCDPKWYKPIPNTLYRNNGDGTFTDVSEQTGIAAHMGKGMGVAVADFDGDGWPDIFVANDKVANFLFHNLGGKKFEEIGEVAGVAVSADGKPLSSMGVDFRDVTNTGRPAIWYTALEKESFPLLLYSGDMLFDDTTARSGVGWATMKMSGWGNGIYDFDNVGDLDNDGRIDAVVTALNAPLAVFHNVTETKNHWIELQFRGTKSNRMGIGARIKITCADGTKQYNHVTTSVGYSSSSDSRVHFGLGPASATVKEIEVLWPSGIRQVLHDVQGDRVVTIEESSQSRMR